jgi:hypothetical protein
MSPPDAGECGLAYCVTELGSDLSATSGTSHPIKIHL